MTASPAVTGRSVSGPAADGVTDLSAIRRCDAILDLLAARRLARSAARRDPALAVLAVLAADVDGAAPRLAAARRRGTRAAPRSRQVTVAAIMASALAALLLAVVAAGTTGIVIASLLIRLGRPGTGLPPGLCDRGRHAARHRRRLPGPAPAPAPGGQ